MANESNEIGNIVKKCKILLLDIEGTTTSISFVKDKLFPYAEENVKQFLENKWEEDDVKKAVESLRKLATEDKEKSVEGVVDIPGEDATKEEQVEGLVGNVKWQMSLDRKAGPLKLLQGLIWKQGYDKGEIKGHVYDDVSAALEQWHSTEGQKVYIYSSGSVEAQKLLFGQSTAGDLLTFIDGHFDTAVGAKQEAASYTSIVEKIGCKSEEVLFLTDIVKEAEAARASGLHAALLSREGNAPLPEEATAAYPVLHSLAELTITNKRKPDPQEEQPAKVPKTDVEDDVKATSETNGTEANTTPTEEPKTEETMEVDETPVDKAPVEVPVDKTPVVEPVKEVNNGDSQEMKDSPVSKVEIEEIKEQSELANLPPSSDKPVVTEENADKTDEKETEKMETEESVTENSSEKDKQQSTETKNEPETKTEEKIPDVVITEIEDVSDKPSLCDVAEIIEDLEPVVEEPPVVEDMEELQNVGEVLEKECDEILSKVQDVTNLDNIPLKPLLNPIAEETMETDHTDSNDIVDRILDTELEMEMKQSNNVELNAVAEITETKTDKDSEKPLEEKPIQEENTIAPTTNDVPEEKTTETKVETTSVTEKVEESPQSNNTTETAAAENKPEVEEEKVEEPVKVESKETPEVQSTPEITESTPAAPTETNDTEKVPEETKKENGEESKEPHVNGKTTNGDTEMVNLNGDASKNEELNSRLSVENGKEVVNGSNGDSRDAEEVQTDSAPETDIKVKTVAVDEPRTDPIEQPTEA